MMTWLPTFLILLCLLVLAWLAWGAGRANRAAPTLDDIHAALAQRTEALERSLRDEVARSAAGTRQELIGTLAQFQQALLAQQGDVTRTQNEQLDSFRVQLATMQQGLSDTLRDTTGHLNQQAAQAREAQDAALKRFADTLNQQLRELTEANERRSLEMRTAVEQKLADIQADNEKKLEQMRQTVDEKLHATLEQRLGESFKQVAERLEHVHRGLGEMQTLAQGVGDLKRMLTNVKTRGVFGEVQLAALLEQVFTPQQYATNVATVPGSSERVEFAIRLPGRDDDGTPLWLPLDAKFPREDYERLIDAQDRADREAAETAAKALETRIRNEAQQIAAKYIAPPHTTDFGVLFVPTEGLYAELLRRPGLMEALQREHRVTLAGPTTLLALLNSLQMGFRTLALQKRSSEVWKVLGAVKTEFAKFGDVLDKTKKKLDEARNTIESAQQRTRVMTRELRGVEALDEHQTRALLPPEDVADDAQQP